MMYFVKIDGMPFWYTDPFTGAQVLLLFQTAEAAQAHGNRSAMSAERVTIHDVDVSEHGG